MSGHESEPSRAIDPAHVNAVFDAVVGRSLPTGVNLVSLALIALGVGAFLTGLFAVGDGGATAWGAFLVGLVYTFAIGQGGIMFSVIQSGTWARWGRPVKRIAESFAFWLPVAYVLLVVFLVLGLRIYAWHPNTIIDGGPVALEPHFSEAISSKPFWLSPPVFVIRVLVLVAALLTLDAYYLRHALSPDLIAGQQRLGAKAPAWWATVTGGRTDLVGALKASVDTQSFMVPILAAAYALVMSMLAFDLLMSLSPWWYSNMFGAWNTVSGFWLSVNVLGFVTITGRKWLGLDRFVKTNVTHDIGKMMLAGSMFWAYTSFAQLLPIWYTDMPEETDYLLVRLFLPEWSWLAQAVAVTCFLAPFTILLSRGIKKMRWPFVAICCLIMFGVFLERTLLVQPSIYFHDPLANPLVLFVWGGTWLGFVGGFIQVVGRALASLPAVAVTDPYLETHPWDVHAHSLDRAHH
jgi:hypothetical protein